MSSAIAEPAIIIRDIELIPEMRAAEALQKEVWGCDDRDIVPLTLLAATKAVGAILIGAFAEATLVGFAYGFLGREAGLLVYHSHQLAVRPSYRNFNLGYKLKLAQRERALAQGVARMTWTFDPLQSLNAHFNFAKLGVVAETYKINFYGAATSSFLHQGGTDRLWVSWPLDSRRVRARLQTEARGRASISDLEGSACLLRVGPNNVPQRGASVAAPGQAHLSVEIPADINTLQSERPELALRWREATRWAFTEATAAGYLIEEFYRAASKAHAAGSYLLSHGKKVADFV